MADIKQPLPFADETFDYINARFLIGLMYPADWVPLLRECWRVTRPGGHICLTEFDVHDVTNSPAFERMQAVVGKALARTGRALVPGIEEARITPMLGAFLREAGWRQTGLQAHVLDYSADTDLHVSNYCNLMAAYRLAQPFHIKTGVITADEWEHLYTQMQIEMMAPTFRGLWYFLSVFGHKA